jgi:hypothetical protein
MVLVPLQLTLQLTPTVTTVAATHSDISRNDTNSLSCESDANTEPIGTTFDEPTVASAHLNVNSRNSNSSNYQGNASTLTVGVTSDATVHQQSDINSSSYQGSTNTVADGVGTAPADMSLLMTLYTNRVILILSVIRAVPR